MSSREQSFTVARVGLISGLGESEIAPTPAKKHKTAGGDAPRKVSKQRKGKLSKLPDMPLDVLYEILSQLQPLDLLKISWTTKAFRRVLTSASSRAVWINSFASIEGLPACPEGLNEVEYASLLFNPRCQHCCKSRAPISWEICRRICKNCQEIETVCASEAWATFPKLGGTFKPFSETLDQILPNQALSVRPRRRATSDLRVFLRSDIKVFFGRVCVDGLSNNDIEAIVDEYTQRLTRRNEFAFAGKLWEAQREAKKDEMKERLKSLRCEKVIEKLKEEGWAEELENHPSTYEGLRDFTGVRVVKPLTDKSWEGLRCSVLAWMNDRKAQRIRRETTERILNRVGELTRILATQLQGGKIDLFLRKEDICWIPDIKATITEGSAEEFEALKAGLADRLPALAAGLKETRSAALLTLLPYENPSAEKLSLATTWFKCEHDRCRALQPKAAMVHNCFKRSYNEASESDQYYMDLMGRPWAPSRGTFYEKKAGFARELVLAVGGDPETMTHEGMEEKGYTFTQRFSTRDVFSSFRSMIFGLGNSPDEIPEWRALKPEEIPESVTRFGNQTFTHRRCMCSRGLLALSREFMDIVGPGHN